MPEHADDVLKPGQHFDPGPFALDLYRLLAQCWPTVAALCRRGARRRRTSGQISKGRDHPGIGLVGSGAAHHV
jgi:hypothetical protein